MSRRPRIPGTRGTAGMRRLQPGDRAGLLIVDWRDPELTVEERRLAKARSDCDRLHRCPECRGGDGLPEVLYPTQLRVGTIEHEERCGVGGERFARLVVAPFWRRVGRPPRFALIDCVVSRTFELDESGVAEVFDPRALGLCEATLVGFERHWNITNSEERDP